MKSALLILTMAVVCLASCKKVEPVAPIDSVPDPVLYKKWYYQTRTRTDFTPGQQTKINTPTTFNGTDYIYFSKHGYSGEYQITNANGITLLRSMHYSYHIAISDKGDKTGSLLIFFKNGPVYYEVTELKANYLRLVQKIYNADNTIVAATIETVFTSD